MEIRVEHQSMLRVLDAVVGGGLQLKPGQMVAEEDLGEFADVLLRKAAVCRITPTAQQPTRVQVTVEPVGTY